AGNIDLVDLAGEGELFGRDEIEVEGGHGKPASSELRMASREERKRRLSIRHSLFAIRRLGCFSRQLLALLDGFFDGADHVERRFRQMVVLAFAETAEALDGVGEVDEFAGRTGEDFSDVERLRQEALDLAGARHGQLVL